jgi:anti-sigma factor RsiW
MKCQKVREKLDPYMAQRLAAPVREAVEAHLRTCSECRQELAGLDQLARLLRRDAAIPPLPEGLNQRIMFAARRRLAARQLPRTTPGNIRRRWSSFSWPMRVAGAATLAAGLLFGILMGQQTWQSLHAENRRQDAQTDLSAIYELDYLTDAPNGSLANTYFSLMQSPENDGA